MATADPSKERVRWFWSLPETRGGSTWWPGGALAPPEIRLATPGAPPIRCLVIGSFYGQSVYRLCWSSRFKEVQRQRNNGRRGLGLLLYQVWEVKTPNKELVGILYVWFNMFVWFSQISVFTPSGSARVGRRWFQSNVQSTLIKHNKSKIRWALSNNKHCHGDLHILWQWPHSKIAPNDNMHRMFQTNNNNNNCLVTRYLLMHESKSVR